MAFGKKVEEEKPRSKDPARQRELERRADAKRTVSVIPERPTLKAGR